MPGITYIGRKTVEQQQLQSIKRLREVGLSPSQAIKLFARAVINYGGIPFELKAKQPNVMTVTAIQELSQGLGEKSDLVLIYCIHETYLQLARIGSHNDVF
jgi:addiction module RelB/DinJ family antitoxin